MPLFFPPAASGASNVTIDEDGFVVITGGPVPFKDEVEDLGGGVIRIHRLIKHPVHGVINVGFSDVQTA